MARGARPFRLLRKVINHDFLLNVLTPEDARSIYDEVEGALAWDYHYWLQRAGLPNRGRESR
jgi:hypothetical protein